MAGRRGARCPRHPAPERGWQHGVVRLRAGPSLLTAFAVAGVGGLAACTGGSAGAGVALRVTPAASVADQPVRITVSGLTPGTAVSLRLRSTDATHVPWSSSATFRASAAGSVNPGRMAAQSGSYTGRSAMGLFWSMKPPLPGPASAYYWPGTRPAVFDLSVTAHDSTLASARLTRRWLAAPTTAGAHTVAASGFDGQFFPPRGVPAGRRRPAVLIIGGSEGGLSSPLLAAALAGHGYPVLTIAYFGAPGLPASLSGIPLEYFARALRWLRRQPQVDPAHVLTLGVSFGSEAALLMGVQYPGLVHGVVAAVPSGVTTSPCPRCDYAAWTLHGRALPFTTRFNTPDPAGAAAAVIPVERIDGPVFLVCGGADKSWDSCGYARAIMTRLGAHHDGYPHELAAYPAAGHGVGYLVPYLPGAGVAALRDGGTSPAANPSATAAVWPRLLRFLAGFAQK
jgi:dienelactone hydrolase